MFGTNWDPFVSDQEQARQAMGQSGQAAYQQLGGALNDQAGYLQRIARGQESVSAQQLKDALARTNAQQASMAAGAAPRDSTMAALMASRNAMQASSGLAGQQALAGIQERQAAQSQLMQALLAQREQEQRNAQFGNQGGKSWLDKFGGAIAGGVKLAGMV